MFASNPFKLAVIDAIPDGAPITLYRCGDFVDLCRGPHVPHTGLVKVRDTITHGGFVFSPLIPILQAYATKARALRVILHFMTAVCEKRALGSAVFSSSDVALRLAVVAHARQLLGLER